MFSNRRRAGQQLARRVLAVLEDNAFSPKDAVVVGLPRGGVPIACEIARLVRCPVDILVSKKMRAPDNQELAIGAVTACGVVVLDERVATYRALRSSYEEAQRVQKDMLVQETRELERHWIEQADMRIRPDWQGKLIILADDGIATGMTIRAAIETVKQRQAAEIWLATPVSSYDTYLYLQTQCDLFVALLTPKDFSAVGCFYDDFHQVDDDEVVASLRNALKVSS